MEEVYTSTFLESVGMGSGRAWINRIILRSRQMDNRERTFSRSNRYDVQGGREAMDWEAGSRQY